MRRATLKKIAAVSMAALCGISAMSLTALAEDAPAKKYIAMCLYGLDNEAWAGFITGAEQFVAQLPEGAAEVEVLTSGGDDNAQIEGIKNFISAHGQDAVFFIDPSSKANTVNLVETCEEAGVYYTIEAHRAEGLSPWDNDHFVAHINQNDFNAGYEMAVCLFEAIGGSGNVFDLYGALGNDAATAREAGFQAALAEYPDIKLVDTQVASFNQQEALNLTETWLASYEDEMDGIFAADDPSALGAIEALKEYGLEGKVKVTGINGSSEGMQAVKDGNLVATHYLNSLAIGGYGAAYAYYASTGEYDFLNGNPANRMIYTKTFPITAENVDEYIGVEPQFDFSLDHLGDIISGYQTPDDIEIPYEATEEMTE